MTAGTIDAWAEGVSVGESVPGRMFLQYGTTMFMIVPTAEPTPVPGMWTTVGTHPEQPSVSGGMATSGAITDWLRRLVDGDWRRCSRRRTRSGIGATRAADAAVLRG